MLTAEGGAWRPFGFQADRLRQAPASQASDADPIAVLRRADNLTRAVRSVRYKARARSTGAVRYDVAGEVVMEGKGANGPERYHVAMTGSVGDGATAYELTFVSDGRKFWMLDRKGKTLDEVADPSAFGPRYLAAMSLVMREYAHPDPFGDEIVAPATEYRGVRERDGVLCQDVFVDYGANQKALWSFGEDGYPKRVERERRRRGELVESTLELRDLEVDPPLDEATAASQSATPSSGG